MRPKELDKAKTRPEKKLNKIRTEQRIQAPDAIKNLSDHKLSPCEIEALRLGLNHHILPRNLQLTNFKLSIEKEVFHVKKEHQLDHKFKDDIKHSATSVCNSGKNRKLHAILQNLSKNDKIRITNYDKGNGIITLNTTDYISKLDKIILDKPKFEEIELQGEKFIDNQGVRSENKSSYFLKKYVASLISPEILSKITPIASQPVKLYGMSKIHKPDCPLCPVVSMIKTAEYHLAKYLDSLIKPQIPTKYMLKSTNGLVDVLKNHESKLSPSNFMVSFDVVSLFTNVPVDEAIDLSAEYVYSSSSHNKPLIVKDIFKKLMKLATSGIFTFEGRYYRQTDGVMMGSPLGPTLANLFLSHLEKN